MAQQSSVMQLSGMAELQRAIAKTPDLAIAGVESAIAATTFAIKQRATSLAPQRTGRLRQSISASAKGLNGRVMISGEAFYWRFVEYGTVRVPARPFVRPSVEAEAEPHEQRLKTVATHLERDFSSGRLL